MIRQYAHSNLRKHISVRGASCKLHSHFHRKDRQDMRLGLWDDRLRFSGFPYVTNFPCLPVTNNYITEEPR